MSSMQFWGVEVKPGEHFKIHPQDHYLLHVSQAALGELKKDKGSQSVCLHLKHDDKKLVIGTLSHEKFPQISLDLVFEREFELSHTWKDGSVYFSGYQLLLNDEETDEDSDFEAEDLFPIATDNGKSEAKETKPDDAKKPDTAAAKPKVNFVEPTKDVKPETEQAEDSDDDDEDFSEDDDDSSDDQGLIVKGGDDVSDEDDDDSDEEDDESNESEDEDDVTPKKAEPSKKRSADSAIKTPVPDKKVKLSTPQQTDGKKVGGHTATPHPAKAGKKLANSDQTKQQAKSGGSFCCKPCNRSFGTEMGLQAHTKAKHGAAA